LKRSHAPQPDLLIVSLAFHFVLSGCVLAFGRGIRNNVSLLPNVTLGGLPFSGYALTVTLVAC